MRSQHPTDVLERENEAYRRFLDEQGRGAKKGNADEGMSEEQLRCKDCKRYKWLMKLCIDPTLRRPFHRVNPGQFACKKFVYRDKCGVSSLS